MKFWKRLFTTSGQARDNLLVAPAWGVALLGLLSGALSVVSVSAVFFVLFAAIGAIAMIQGLTEIGRIQFGAPETQARDLLVVVRSFATAWSFLVRSWPAMAALGGIGLLAALAYRELGRTRPTWSAAGAALVFFGTSAIALTVASFEARLALGDNISNRDHWSSLDVLALALETDVQATAYSTVVAIVGGWVMLSLWKWWFELFGRRLSTSRYVVAEGDGSTGRPLEATEDLRAHQDRLRRIKQEIAELRSAPEPIPASRPGPEAATVVVEREPRRRTPAWMAPLANVNLKIGRPLLIAFAASLILWGAGDALRGEQAWGLQRGYVRLDDQQPQATVSVLIEEYTGLLRVFALTGRGAIDARLRPLNGEGPELTIAEDFQFSMLATLGDDTSRNVGITYPTRNMTPGDYDLVLTRRSGDGLLMAYSLGRDSPLGWKLAAFLLGLGAGGMVASAFGALALAGANAAAYLRR